VSGDIKILFAPDFGENQYIENIYNVIDSIDSVVLTRVEHITPKLLQVGVYHYDVAIVHWLENWLVNDKDDKRLTLRSSIRFLIRLFVLKLIAKKVIYVRHNVYPHSLNHRDGRLAKWLTDFACILADICVAHSGHLNKSYTYIPHPLYKFKKNMAADVQVAKTSFVIFGRIIEYKAIDKLLEVWGKVPLLITGSVGSKEYVSKLLSIKAERSLESVDIDARFLSNEEAQDIVSQSAGLILAHCEDDMIVSGSFFFAASLGVSVYAVKSPFLSWLKAQFNYSGLFIFDSLPDMVNAIHSNNLASADRVKISTEAQKLFGDNVIKEAFEKLLVK
jgi:beta-1,4-mannosyltransferase